MSAADGCQRVPALEHVETGGETDSEANRRKHILYQKLCTSQCTAIRNRVPANANLPMQPRLFTRLVDPLAATSVLSLSSLGFVLSR